MLTKKIKVSKNIKLQHIVKNLNEYIIKIDYFDQSGIKSFEDNIPVKYIFHQK